MREPLPPPHLVAEERVHVGTVVKAPHLDRPIVGAAEQLVRAIAERQGRDGVAVARVGLHKRAGLRVKHVHLPVAASDRKVLPV